MAIPHFSIFCLLPLLCHRHCSVLRKLCLLSFQWGLVDLTHQIPPYSQEEITVECEFPSNTHLITSEVKSRFLCREACGSINRFHLFPKKLLSTAMSMHFAFHMGLKRLIKHSVCAHRAWEPSGRDRQGESNSLSCMQNLPLPVQRRWMVHARFSPVAVTSIYPMHSGQLHYARQFVKL